MALLDDGDADSLRLAAKQALPQVEQEARGSPCTTPSGSMSIELRTCVLTELAEVRDRLAAVEEELRASRKERPHLDGRPVVPVLLIGNRAPPPRRPIPEASSAASLSTSAGSKDGSASEAPDVEQLRRSVDELQAGVTRSTSRLEAALDAARGGIARLAKELHYEKEDRKRHNVEFKRWADEVIEESVERAARASLQQSRQQPVKPGWSSGDRGEAAQLRGSTKRASGESPLARVTSLPLLRGVASAPKVVRTPTTATDFSIEQATGDVSATASALVELGIPEVFESDTSASVRLEAMITRPTFRFVHRIALAVKRRTGFPQGIAEEWPSAEEGKLEFLGQMWSAVVETLGIGEMSFRAQDVVRCTQRENTRRFLHLFALSALRKRGSSNEPTTKCRHFVDGASARAALLESVSNSCREDGGDDDDGTTSVCWH